MKFKIEDPNAKFQALMNNAIKTIKSVPLHRYDLLEDGVTMSLMTAWRSCPTKARCIMQGMYKPGFSRAITFGNVFHSALEWGLTQYKNGNIETPDWFTDTCNIRALVESLSKEFSAEYTLADGTGKGYFDEAFNFLPIIIPLYFKYWKEDFFGAEKKEFIEIEKSFNVKYLDRVMLRGKRDAIYKDANGGLWLMEHKTKAQIPEHALSMTISRDFQVMLYIAAYYIETGIKLKGVLYNIIRKPMLRQKRTESIDEFYKRVAMDIQQREQHYFIRFPVSIPWSDVGVFMHRFEKEMIEFISWVHDDPELDYQFTKECNGVYGQCPFLDYCDGGKSDTSLYHVRERLHPELGV